MSGPAPRTGSAIYAPPMTAPAPGPFRGHLDAAVAAVGFQVNPDTVLRARAALLAEADRLDQHVEDSMNEAMGIGLCGGDPVSADARTAFGERISVTFEQCRAYNRDLREAAGALDEIARGYGYTDDEISASFQGTR